MASSTRINTALSEGLLSLPEGQVHVMRPPSGTDLSGLSEQSMSISHSAFPDYQTWKTSGYDVSSTPSEAETVCVIVPRSKALARSMIAQAAELGQLILVDGQKTDGVDSLFKAVKKRIGAVPTVTKAHGRLFWFDATDAFSDWAAPPPTQGPDGFYNTAGVFSDGAVDKGSALLADALPETLKGRVADFGAGWGYLAAKALQSDKVTHLDLIEAESLALDCAKLNVVDDRAAFHWADATAFKAAEPYDAVIMNPPFHQGRQGDPSLGQAFISSAARNLKPNGSLWMVANRHLPYEAHLATCFRNVTELSGNAAFKIFHATRPTR